LLLDLGHKLREGPFVVDSHGCFDATREIQNDSKSEPQGTDGGKNEKQLIVTTEQ
jgi:hypothetical protein